MSIDLHLSVFATASFLLTTPIAVAQCAQWSDRFAQTDNGADLGISCLESASLGGRAVYAGGQYFTVVGLSAPVPLARWDGVQWADVGGGVFRFGPPALVSELRAHTESGGTQLYVGGVFDYAGGPPPLVGGTGIPAGNIARWDGSSWNTLGGGVDYWVHAIEWFDSGSGEELYAGGGFYSAGSVQARGIAKWNGTTWSDVGGGVSVTPVWWDFSVRALIVFDDGSGPALYAGGGFTHAGGVAAMHIARWNGTLWSPLGSGTNGTTVYSLAVHDDGSGPALYVGGDFTVAGGVASPGIARWDGSVWSSVGGGLSTISNNYVLALHQFDDGTGGGVELYAGGTFTTAGGDSALRIAKWNGSTWSALGSGVIPYGVSDMTAFDENADGTLDLMVSGNFTSAGGVPSSNLAAWRGCHATLGASYCYGSGTACPCGNASASGSRQGCEHSAGFGAHLLAQGSASVANDDQVFSVISMPVDKPCLLFVGSNALNGGNGVPFGDGLRCTGTSVHHLGLRASDGSGVASWGPNFTSRGLWSAGDTRFFQVWFRDPSGPCSSGTNTSSALVVEFTN